jgi:hypothetical protein
MGDDPKEMHQRYDDYVTPSQCEQHHQIMELKLELLRQKDASLEDKIIGIETRLNSMDAKMDKILGLQESFNKYTLWLAVGIILTLIGVLTGRALDFGWVI